MAEASITRADALRVLPDADRAIVWSAHDPSDAEPWFLVHWMCLGMTEVEAERLLLDLAADLHEQRTGSRAGAVMLETGDVSTCLRVLTGGRRYGAVREGLLADFERLYRERMVR